MNKNKNIIHDQRHLSLSDRSFIEQGLLQQFSFRYMAQMLNKDPSTISKEIRNKSYSKPPIKHYRKCKGCIFYKECRMEHVCGDTACKSRCRLCIYGHPTEHCNQFISYDQHCYKTRKPPYVCNGCPNTNLCTLEQRFYNAKKAQQQYEKDLSDSRSGINLTPNELQELNDLISPLVLKGQPLSHIFAVHGDEIPVCRRTLYNYLDQRVFTARNIDLPRRVRYKKRKKRSEPRKRNLQQVYRNKRTYVDFEKYTAAFPELDVVEMDTVKGNRAAGKCLLTLLFRSCSFMIIILLPDCTQKSVIAAINKLCDTIGIRTFKKYFPILLTDNGSEFKNPWDIEKNESGTQRTKVFYCDPYVSNQKGRIEKNHEYIRYVIPKGRSMHKYTQEDINLMASHINSTARDGLNNATPYDLAELLLDKRIPLLTGQFKVAADDVCLKPSLIDNNVAARNSISEEGGECNV